MVGMRRNSIVLFYETEAHVCTLTCTCLSLPPCHAPHFILTFVCTRVFARTWFLPGRRYTQTWALDGYPILKRLSFARIVAEVQIQSDALQKPGDFTTKRPPLTH